MNPLPSSFHKGHLAGRIPTNVHNTLQVPAARIPVPGEIAGSFGGMACRAATQTSW